MKRQSPVEQLLALRHGDRVVASMHVHLDHARCAEVIVLRGSGAELRRLAKALRGLKGVHAGELTLTKTEDADHGHTHRHSHPHGH